MKALVCQIILEICLGQLKFKINQKSIEVNQRKRAIPSRNSAFLKVRNSKWQKKIRKVIIILYPILNKNQLI
jgi:hypothetical protein